MFDDEKLFDGFRSKETSLIKQSLCNGESCMFLCLPSVGKRKFSRYITSLKEISVDSQYYDCRYIQPSTLDKFKRIIKSRKEKTLLVLDSVDNQFSNVEFLETLDFINNHHRDKCTIASFTSAIKYYADGHNKSFLSRYSFLNQNIFYLSNMTTHDTTQIVKDTLTEYTNNKSMISKLVDLSGGNNAYLMHLIRGINTNTITNTDLYSPNNLYDSLLQLEFLGDEILDKIGKRLSHTLLTNTYHTDSLLRNIGLVSREGKLFSILFEIYLDRLRGRRVGKLPNEIFTKQELSVYNLLIQNQKVIVSREDIAKAMWGVEHLEKYSEYAIDKIIQKIRNKAKASGMNKTIETKRGRGYYLV